MKNVETLHEYNTTLRNPTDDDRQQQLNAVKDVLDGLDGAKTEAVIVLLATPDPQDPGALICSTRGFGQHQVIEHLLDQAAKQFENSSPDKTVTH